uniref:K2 killer toxin n=1 Tax=Saccharomyces killer virus M2-4 TaxID=2041200 RepID=A0A291FEA7_9VIRU|nr:K2 killer toxin [Saccharomyces killer virus M2-4]
MKETTTSLMQDELTLGEPATQARMCVRLLRFFIGLTITAFVIAACIIKSATGGSGYSNAVAVWGEADTPSTIVGQLVERGGFQAWAVGAGIYLFAKIAYDTSKVTAAVCNPEALIAITSYVAYAPTLCAGAYVIGAMSGAMSAGLALYAGYKGWQWGGPGGMAEREDVASFYSPLLNNTLYVGGDHTADYDSELATILGSVYNDVVHLGVYYDNSTGIVKRDSRPSMISWTVLHDNMMITSYHRPDQLGAAATAYKAYATNTTRVGKRQDGEWVSYSVYGENVDYERYPVAHLQEEADACYESLGNMITSQVQPGTQRECYAMDQKVCAAVGFSSDAGVNSAIVGEAYFYAYGGVDGECDSG